MCPSHDGRRAGQVMQGVRPVGVEEHEDTVRIGLCLDDRHAATFMAEVTRCYYLHVHFITHCQQYSANAPLLFSTTAAVSLALGQ